MIPEKPFLLVIEATPGLNTHSVYTTLNDATKVKEKAFQNNQDPICIYNLISKEYVWINKTFPPYGETISDQIIKLYLTNSI